MQMHDYDFRKIRQDLKDLDRRIKEIEEGLVEFKQGLDNYQKKYGTKTVVEWVESIDASKQKDPEE